MGNEVVGCHVACEI